MCGIAGILSLAERPVSEPRLRAMTDIIAHRGPDGFGQWLNPSATAALGHRRLSIIDLSAGGHQPMSFLHLTITFNGEIYNYIELKRELSSKGYTFKTESDTEVLLMCYHLKGAACLNDLDGMFSFAIWDEQKKELFCARDRFGEKPFYYSKQGDELLFGSEIKQLFAAGIPKEINHNRLFYYAASGNMTDQKNLGETYYQHIHQLPHSHYMTVSANGKISLKKYWEINTAVDHTIREKEAVEKFSALLQTSIGRRLRSDVPVGTSLSGGMDSTTIAGYICRDFQPGSSLNTFTATFRNFEKDESKYIGIFKERYPNINSYFVEPTVEGFFDEIHKLFFHHDEPMGSTSIYAQYKVMELAKKQQITVLLDGQGADEYLAGYNKYWVVLLNQLYASRSKDYNSEKEYVQKQIAYTHQPGFNVSLMLRHPGFHRFLSNVKKTLIPPRKAVLPSILHPDIQNQVSKDILRDDTLFQDLNDSLRQSVMFSGLQDLLRFADRNSMAHSREVRLPFLSHDLVEFVFTLPSSMKMHQGWSKYILRQSQAGRLPEEICWRREKIGYVTPQESWFKSPLATDFFRQIKTELSKSGVFQASYLQSLDSWTMVNLYFLLQK